MMQASWRRKGGRLLGQQLWRLAVRQMQFVDVSGVAAAGSAAPFAR